MKNNLLLIILEWCPPNRKFPPSSQLKVGSTARRARWPQRAVLPHRRISAAVYAVLISYTGVYRQSMAARAMAMSFRLKHKERSFAQPATAVRA